MQVVALVVSLGVAVVGVTLFVRAIRQMLRVIRMGQPAHRTDAPAARTVNMLKETLGHTRMLQWTVVGVAHWFVFVGFGLLFFTLLTAFGQLFDPHFALPLIGHFAPFEWATELVTWVMVIAIIGLTAYRLTRPKGRVRGADGRFYGSTMWQAYFVEMVILGVGLCILTLRGLEYALMGDEASVAHFPLTFWLGEAFSGASEPTLENAIWAVATLKIVVSFVWMITISLNLTMGVAWHRFAAFFNIFFKRDASGRTALGAAKPLTNAGQPVTLDDIDDLDEDVSFGVGKIEDFSWKGLLDLTTCTECGRCQSQCPAWNTEKPLSPKLMILQLRDHAYAKAPYVLAGEEGRDGVPAAALAEAERPLVGPTEGDAWDPTGGGIIDPDVLWSCVTCGACVQQCPVDIEHVDHIVDMRRYQVLVESSFPAELNQLFKGLETKGNPWNMAPTARLEWTKGLDFDVPVVGEDLESLESVDWLFWVGCAGAYEDRAKKTARAVAELLNIAGVSFGVLGNGETCTGDSARRAGNEFVFQGLAQQNIETFKEYKVKKVVSTCAHCFNTLKNEYTQFGIELEVVHHTQLLNRLVREGRLTPVASGAGAAKRSITYHDPCYIGRHNQVFEPPRELLQVLPGADFVEMERNSERSFCCGAGGARMWMEEKIGERINVNRTTEAVGTGADQIAVGCPFCRVMLSDGLTALQAQGEARAEVEVLDVAQMLLASVKGESATRAAPASASGGGSAGGGTTTVTATEVETPVEVKAEPEAGDVTQTPNTVTETADVGPAAKSSGGSSLFDTPAPAEDKPAEEKPAAPAAPSGGSLFDTPAPAGEKPAEDKPAAPAAPSGGSLFDTPAPAEEKPAAPSSPPSGGSLFDVTPTGPAEEKPAAPAAPSSPPSGGSLFDVEPTTAAEDKPTTPASSGSLFDVAPAGPTPVEADASETTTEPAEPAKVSDGPRSLFDVEPQAAPDPVAISEAATAAASDEPAVEDEPADDPDAILDADGVPEPEAPASAPATASRGLFDIDEPADDPQTIPNADDTQEQQPASPAEAESEETSQEPKRDVDLDQPRSLFDL